MIYNKEAELKKISIFESAVINDESLEFMQGLESLSSKDQLLVRMKFEEFLNRKIMHIAAEGKITRDEMMANSIDSFIKRACNNIAFHITQQSKELGFVNSTPTPEGGAIVSAAISIYRPNFNSFKPLDFKEILGC